MIRRAFHNHHGVLWCLFVLAFLARAWGLRAQPATDDEAAVASAASNYLQSGLFGQVMWYHPPLRNLIVFLSGKLFGGYTAWGLRFGSVLLGSLSIPALGYLAQSLFRDRTVSYLAALFLCIDPLHIALSRQAVQETTTAFFILAGVLATLRGIRTNALPPTYLAGALFGLAAASKWHGIFPWAVSAAAYLAAPWLTGDGDPAERRLPSRALTVLAAYVAVPLMVYAAVYLPWLGRGHSLVEFADFQQWLVTRQYHHTASAYAETFLPKGAWWWFLRPTAWADFVFLEGKAHLTIAMGNFLVWGLTLPSLVLAGRRWIRERSFQGGYVLALFLASYLPLVLTTRGLWAFNALSVVPFAFLLSSTAFAPLADGGKVARRGAALYLAAAITVSALLYPASAMQTLDHAYLKPLADLYSPH
jgi:dolichyl-phosphate-mannose--protein O-mannosyl transferase